MTLGSEEYKQAKRKARENYPALLEPYPEFKILEAVTRDHDITAAEAARRINDLSRAALASNDSESFGDHAYHIALCLIEIAKRTAPQSQAKLVESVVCLQKYSLVDEQTSDPVRQDGYLVWSELPALGYTAADEWNAVDVLDPSVSADEIRLYENFIAFLAQLTAAAPADYDNPKIGEMDFSLWSLRAFKDAFDKTGKAVAAPEAAVRVAALWVIYAAERLWANIEHGRVFGRRGTDDETVMTREMWDSWQRGFQEMRTTCSDERTGALIHDALEQMRRFSAQA
ncbi:hypothetical protein F5Y14DRAFT_408736 [Nemania sp. NC0429]|nr:hypothetical protein F5Y14DRAFT_408736 [Nemania sp. NC0429]